MFLMDLVELKMLHIVLYSSTGTEKVSNGPGGVENIVPYNPHRQQKYTVSNGPGGVESCISRVCFPLPFEVSNGPGGVERIA